MKSDNSGGATYVVGVDLGTTNCAVAYAELARAEQAGASCVRVLDLEQLVAPGEVGLRPLLPSFLYTPGKHELPTGALQLPWEDQEPNHAVGELARMRGSKVPGRVISSAKSWLSHQGVDRRAPILPWGGAADVASYSPLDASARYLSHIRQGWNNHFPHAPLECQEVVLTVPASFDETARRLTLEAADLAGMGENLLLIEEPQAAFYDYFNDQGHAAPAQGTRLILVVDVGGGTTDLTLIEVKNPPQGSGQDVPELRRLAVGDHILLGGDNMDMALAHLAEERMTGRKGGLDPARWALLCQACRLAKETLLSSGDGTPQSVRVTIPGRGSRLLGGSIGCELTRDEVMETIVDGFLPHTPLGASPTRHATGSGLKEWGLPYASDPAITRHVAAFLLRHCALRPDHLVPAADTGTAASTGAPGQDGKANPLDTHMALPDAVLLNGGVFASEVLGRRLVSVVNSWKQAAGVTTADHPSKVEGADLQVFKPSSVDLAVARGAAHYGLARHGVGQRIGGGAARAFYVGVVGESPRAKSKKADPPSQSQSQPNSSMGLCIIPRHQEPGQAVHLSDRTFNLVVGRPVRFNLYNTSSDRTDRPGDLVVLEGDDFHKLPPIQTILPFQGGKAEIPVTLQATLTEVGVLEVSCSAVDRDARWKLEFSLRHQDGEEIESPTPPSQLPPSVAGVGAGAAGASLGVCAKAMELATVKVNQVFGKAGDPLQPKDIKKLTKNLEVIFSTKRETWSIPLLRELWELVRPGVKRRRRSAEHEAVFFSLSGFCLRPGFGFPFDAWRVGELSGILQDGVQYHKDPRVWQSWWVMWRRVAGGLSADLQEELVESVSDWILPQPDGAKPKGRKPQGQEEMIRLVAGFERISPAHKVRWGNWFLDQVVEGQAVARSAWALARLGARVPFYASAHQVVHRDTASAWLESLLRLDWSKTDNGAFAAAHIARATGDRTRDLDLELRQRVAKRLEQAKAPQTYVQMVLEAIKLEEGDEGKLFGESLPQGLKLVR